MKKYHARSILILALITVVLLPGCSADKTADANEHNDEMLQATIWAHDKEIFIEHSIPVAGAAAEFLFHFTSLETGKAVSPVGQVLLLEAEGTGPLQHTIVNKEKEGIFHEEITIPSAGHWTISLLENDHKHYLFNFDVYASEAEAEEAHSHAEEAGHTHEAEDANHDHEGEEHEHSADTEHTHEAEDADHDHEGADHDHGTAEIERHSDHAPEGISLLKEQQWNIGVTTSLALKTTLVKRLNLPAKVVSPPGSRAVILPPAAGRIFPPEGRPYPSVGEKVVKGQVLAMLEAPVSGSDVFQLENLKAELAIKLAEAEAEEIKANAALKQAKQSHQRIEKLFQRKAKSTRELEESQAGLEAAQARYDAALASKNAHRDSLNSLKMNKQQLGTLKAYPKVPITAPMNGFLSEVNPAMGEHVLPEHTLFTIIEPSRVYIEGRLSESDLLKIKREPDATFLMPGSDRKYPNIIADGLGKLLRIGLEVDPTTRTVPVTYALENPGKVLRTGMMLTLCVESNTSENSIAIPESAIVDMEGRPTAFVQLAGEIFVKRDLLIGIKDGGMVQILRGIEAGERVVSGNAYSVRLASANTSEIGHGHVH